VGRPGETVWAIEPVEGETSREALLSGKRLTRRPDLVATDSRPR
jgi:hypothetical protein